MTWERQKFKINKAEVKILENKETLCENSNELFVFVKLVSLAAARSLCYVHGGNIFTPDSEEENKELIDLANQYKSRCEDKETKTIVWLGLKKIDNIFHDDGNKATETKNSNWTMRKIGQRGQQNFHCSALFSDGRWHIGINNWNCKVKRLCAVCSIKDPPTFTCLLYTSAAADE